MQIIRSGIEIEAKRMNQFANANRQMGPAPQYLNKIWVKVKTPHNGIQLKQLYFRDKRSV